MRGRVKLVENTAPRMGSAFRYLFLKVQAGPAEWQEEHWLVTEAEATRFAARSEAGFGPLVHGFNPRLGVLVPSTSPLDEGLNIESVFVRRKGADHAEQWTLTGAEIERIRARVERNAEDIERNRESWLADLLD